MPDDSIMDMVNNIESMYNDKNAMFDKWVEEGDVWSERSALKEANALAAHFAEALESSDMITGKYSPKEIRQAADEMLEEFEDYREESIRYAVEKAKERPKKERVMNAADVEHAKKYEVMAQEFGIDKLKKLIPASPQRVRAALEKGDDALNSIPLVRWDRAGLAIEGAERLSMAEKVSLLKHVAKWHYA